MAPTTASAAANRHRVRALITLAPINPAMHRPRQRADRTVLHGVNPNGDSGAGVYAAPSQSDRRPMKPSR
jgi:hypothetical protein